MAKETQTGALYQPRGGGMGRVGGRLKREGKTNTTLYSNYKPIKKRSSVSNPLGR